MERIFTRRTVETCQLKHMRNGFSFTINKESSLKTQKELKNEKSNK